MGLINKTKSALGMGDGEADVSEDVPDEWIDEVDSEVQESDEVIDEEVDHDTEPAEEEWDSAYKFAEEFLEVRGFANMVDFTNKCMAHKIDQSPMYRDRISNGVNTMNQITSMQEQMRQIRGEDTSGTDYGQQAQKLKDANDLIDQAQRLSGEEDAMVNEIIGLGHELADSISQAQFNNQGSGNVNSDVNQRDETL